MATLHSNNGEAFENGAGVADMIVEGGPHTTIRNCRFITTFIANAIVCQGQSDIEFNSEDQDAVFRILNTVASALAHVEKYVTDRVEVANG